MAGRLVRWAISGGCPRPTLQVDPTGLKVSLAPSHGDEPAQWMDVGLLILLLLLLLRSPMVIKPQMVSPVLQVMKSVVSIRSLDL